MITNIINGPVEQEEVLAYQTRALEKYGDSLKALDIRIDGEDVELTYHLEDRPFERVRRITGYLVGTMEQWNDAKKAEERDRVKHDV